MNLESGGTALFCCNSAEEAAPHTAISFAEPPTTEPAGADVTIRVVGRRSIGRPELWLWRSAHGQTDHLLNWLAGIQLPSSIQQLITFHRRSTRVSASCTCLTGNRVSLGKPGYETLPRVSKKTT